MVKVCDDVSPLPVDPLRELVQEANGNSELVCPDGDQVGISQVSENTKCEYVSQTCANDHLTTTTNILKSSFQNL